LSKINILTVIGYLLLSYITALMYWLRYRPFTVPFNILLVLNVKILRSKISISLFIQANQNNEGIRSVRTKEDSACKIIIWERKP